MSRDKVSRRRFLHLALVAGTGSALAACTPSAPTPAPAKPAEAPKPAEQPKAAAPTKAPAAAATTAPAQAKASTKTLTVGFHQEPQNLDPYSTTTAAFQSVTAATIEQLVYFGADDPKLIPGLATSWKWLDPQTLELKLRQGVKFSNGEEFDAAAAAYSIGVMMKSTAYSVWSSDYEKATPIDKYTVQLKTKTPSGIALPGLARGSYVYPPKYHSEVGAEKFGLAPIGTGPYKFVEWQKGSRVVFEPNASYWGEKAKLGGIVWRIIPEESPRVAALQAGEVQLVTNLSVGAVGRIKSDSKLDLVSRRGLRIFGTFFEMRIDHPVKNKVVRQACNYAVDKDALVKLYGGEATVLQGQWLTQGTPGFNTSLKAYPYDPKKAKDLLAQAGYPNGFETTLSYTIDRYPLDKELGQAVAGYLEGVGIKVTQQALEYGKFRDNFRGGVGKAGPMFQWGLLTPPDAAMTLSQWRKGQDYRRFEDNPAVDDLLESGVRESDEAKKAEIYSKLLGMWYDDPPFIYLVVPNDIYGKSKGLKGWESRTDQVVDLSAAGLD